MQRASDCRVIDCPIHWKGPRWIRFAFSAIGLAVAIVIFLYATFETKSGASAKEARVDRLESSITEQSKTLGDLKVNMGVLMMHFGLEPKSSPTKR